MKSKIWNSVFVLLLAMNIGAAIMFGLHFVQTRSAGDPKDCPLVSNDNHLYALLGLSPEQQASISPLARDFHENIGKLSREIHEKRNSMISMLEQDPVDMDQVTLIRKEILSIQSTIQQGVFEHLLKMKEILTPDQRKVFFQALRQSFITQNLHCNQ